MAEPNLNEVLDLMHEIAPLELAAEWDNVGLLLRADAGRTQVGKCLLTIDLTDAVITEAAQFGADLVISYHPPIFRPLARLDAADPTQGRVVRALMAGFSVYSPHTALDAAPAGLADWLVEGAVGDAVPEAVHVVGDGYGRFAELSKPISWSGLLERLKAQYGVSHLQVARPQRAPSKVRSVAVAAGAGSGALRGVEADVFITGEMSHHDVLAAVAARTSVVLAGHSNTERGFLRVLAKRLTAEFGAALKLRVAKSDRDPLTVT
ncbi:MAG: Nif3-like dinuclear metal center hexameric protein [Planctomycetes bacterium]|nr:Nif3-like dinuclear metal center hexameric protein [Planctomycetota bacterium]